MIGPEFSHPAERERSPPIETFFPVDAMTNEQIIVQHRGQRELADRGQSMEESRESLSVASVGDRLNELLFADVRDLAQRAPERIRSLVLYAVTSTVRADWDLAAETARSIASYDWPFVRDVYVAFDTDKKYRKDDAILPDTVSQAIPIMMRDLTPERRADFNAHDRAAGGYGDFAPLPDDFNQ